MKTLRTHDGKYLAPTAEAAGRRPELLLSRERVGLFSTPPGGAQEFEFAGFLGRVRSLGQEIKSQLVAMDEEVEVVLLGLLTGENVFFLSLPGAAKTTLARLIAQGVGGKLFRINLNPDISRNDLFGALDPNALREGRWARKLSGLATASLAITDEFLCAVVA